MSYELAINATHRQSRCSQFLVVRTTVKIQKQEL